MPPVFSPFSVSLLAILFLSLVLFTTPCLLSLGLSISILLSSVNISLYACLSLPIQLLLRHTRLLISISPSSFTPCTSFSLSLSQFLSYSHLLLPGYFSLSLHSPLFIYRSLSTPMLLSICVWLFLFFLFYLLLLFYLFSNVYFYFITKTLLITVDCAAYFCLSAIFSLSQSIVVCLLFLTV